MVNYVQLMIDIATHRTITISDGLAKIEAHYDTLKLLQKLSKDWLTDGEKVKEMKESSLSHSIMAREKSMINSSIKEEDMLKEEEMKPNGAISFETGDYVIIKDYVRKKNSIPSSYPPLRLEFVMKRISVELVLYSGTSEGFVSIFVVFKFKKLLQIQKLFTYFLAFFYELVFFLI